MCGHANFFVICFERAAAQDILKMMRSPPKALETFNFDQGLREQVINACIWHPVYTKKSEAIC